MMSENKIVDCPLNEDFDWGIQHLKTGLINQQKTVAEAKAWVESFPQIYRLVSRVSAREWKAQR